MVADPGIFGSRLLRWDERGVEGDRMRVRLEWWGRQGSGALHGHGCWLDGATGCITWLGQSHIVTVPGPYSASDLVSSRLQTNWYPPHLGLGSGFLMGSRIPTLTLTQLLPYPKPSGSTRPVTMPSPNPQSLQRSPWSSPLSTSNRTLRSHPYHRDLLVILCSQSVPCYLCDHCLRRNPHWAIRSCCQTKPCTSCL